jgi:hypothetical protein
MLAVTLSQLGPGLPATRDRELRQTVSSEHV